MNDDRHPAAAMSTIGELLALRERIHAVSDSAALDAELLLAFCLGRERSHLYAWPEREVVAEAERRFRELLSRRAAGEPVAYLIGRREFWSLQLAVDDSTLIPRPDTERLVEVALELLPAAAAEVLDLGTGTGAIALALAVERPRWSLLGVDVDARAVALAIGNAERLGIDNARFLESDWFSALPAERCYALIVSNPPYIDAEDPHLRSGDVRFEPRRALVAAEHGLAAIAAIAAQAPAYLQRDGRLLFEHGAGQALAVRTLLAQRGFADIVTWRDWGGRERVTGGQWSAR
jgi:release factor glutamine methyltransferase